MIEDGAGQHEAIRESHRYAYGNSVTHVSKHAAGRGTMEINRVANAREQSGNHVRQAIDGKSDVADESFVENFINSFAVVSGARRFAHNPRALRRCRWFRPAAPR